MVQPENYLYDERKKWCYKGYSYLEEVIKKHGYDNPNFVFGNTDKRLDAGTVFNASPSLLLLYIEDGEIFIKTFEKQRIQLNFWFNKHHYQFFKITQEDLKETFRTKSDGTYALISNSIVFSLTDKFSYDNKYYKVVAQFLE